jgi:hypothetical protein
MAVPAKRNCPPPAQGAVGNLDFPTKLYGLGNHILEKDFERHGMSATFVGKEEFAITVKNAVLVGDMVLAIIAMEVNFKLGEVEAAPVLSVPFCLFYLADQSRIHCFSLLF